MGLEIVGITLFVLLIGASIALHEIGHLVPAKKFGVRVTDYMVGFGPTIWSKVRGETRYGIKAFPVGGYIRMIGMLPPGKDDPEGTARTMNTGRFAAMIAQAREQSLEEVRPGDEHRVFYKLPVHKRLIIMLGGPFMNLVLAFLLFGVVLVGIGLPTPTTAVNSVVACTPSAAQPSVDTLPSGACPAGSEPTPAASAGILSGDVLVSVGPVASSSWEDLTTWIRANPGRSTSVVVERNGGQVTLPLVVADVERPVLDEFGEPTGAVEQVGFLGVSPSFEYQAQPISSVPAYMWDLTYRSAAAIVSLPVRIYELVDRTLIGGGERSLDSPVSVVGASRLGGEIAAMEQPLTAKIATFLGLAASLNLFLFLFNLLPILPLDGGHVAGALYEGAKRKVARVRGKPDPGPVDTAKLLPVAYVVAVVLLAVGVVVIWADLVKPITFG
jgi:membrane-associated protease RseP (regulator of RpoE activity)